MSIPSQPSQFTIRPYNPETDRDWVIQEHMSAYTSLLSLSAAGQDQFFTDLINHIDSFQGDSDNDEQKRRFWVASTVEGDLAGCVALHIKLKHDQITDEWYWSSDISAVLVSETYRNCKLAKDIMDMAEAELAPDGSQPEECTVEVHRDCSDALGIYIRRDYEVYETREIRYYDRDLVTYFMRRLPPV